MKPELDLTGCSERERKLVEALRGIKLFGCDLFGGVNPHIKDLESQAAAFSLHTACQAYLKKPEPVPVIPDWDDLSLKQQEEVKKAYWDTLPSQEFYTRIRRITAKAPE